METASTTYQGTTSITPVSTAVNAIVAGESNTITGTSNCIAGGTVITISNSSSTANFAGGGNANSITNSINSTILGGTGSSIEDSKFCSIDSCTNCDILGGRTNNSSMKSCTECEIKTAGGAGSGEHCVILGSTRSYIGKVGGGVAGDHMVIIGSKDVDMSYWGSGTTCTVAAFDGLPHPGGGANAVRCFIAAGTNGVNTNSFSHSTILGSNWSSGHAGHFMFADSSGGTTHSTFANSSFSVRSAGGARFFTNTANTTGMTLAAGGSSWAAVSDRNVKENINELGATGCQLIAQRLKSVPVCTYNYIGNPEEQLCYGPIAQDWHDQFGATGVTGPVLDLYGEAVYGGTGPTGPSGATGVTGPQLFEVKPAKDPLCIETMDMLGVLMATVKHLQNQVQSLQSRVDYLESFHP